MYENEMIVSQYGEQRLFRTADLTTTTTTIKPNTNWMTAAGGSGAPSEKLSFPSTSFQPFSL
jgi:hypothetical protein